MSVAVYSEWLSAFGADRAARLYAEGVIDRVYAKLWPLDAAAESNRSEWDTFRRKGVPLWAWLVCSPDQEMDATAAAVLAASYPMDGILINIEKPLEGVSLFPLVSRVAKLGLPVVASLAGANPNHALYDHRTLDRFGVYQEWQAYVDSGEGPPPDVAVRELYTPSRVLPGRQYRAMTKAVASAAVYGWGDLSKWAGRGPLVYAAYNRHAFMDADILSDPNSWPPYRVSGRRGLWNTNKSLTGTLLGFAPYSRIRVAILADGIAADRGITRSLEEWAAFASSARAPRAARRPVSVYLAERASDGMLRAVA